MLLESHSIADPLDQFHAGRPIAVQYNLRYYSTASEALMRPSVVLLPLILLIPSALLAVSGAASESTDTSKAGSNQSLTLENLGRGIKSAAKNIEEEIPKIGPAIGDTLKKVMGSDKEKDRSKTPHDAGKSKK